MSHYSPQKKIHTGPMYSACQKTTMTFQHQPLKKIHETNEKKQQQTNNKTLKVLLLILKN